MRRALLLFVDGLGLGANDPTTNPVVAANTPFLDSLLPQRLVATPTLLETPRATLVPTDATLATDGLPQSGTGQTTLLTGVNAARIEGRHVTAYPTKALRAELETHNIFRQVQERQGKTTLANVYTPEYFTAVESGRLRHAAITFAALSAGVRLRGLDDLRAGRAVFHDLTNARLRGWGHDVPAQTPAGAGRILAQLANEHHLTVFEFFLGDLAAHGRVPYDPAVVVEMLDEVLRGAVEAADLSQGLIMVASDHGNLEDRRATSHTRNPVPTLVIGDGHTVVGAQIHSLMDITPALVRWIGEDSVDG